MIADDAFPAIHADACAAPDAGVVDGGTPWCR